MEKMVDFLFYLNFFFFFYILQVLLKVVFLASLNSQSNTLFSKLYPTFRMDGMSLHILCQATLKRCVPLSICCKLGVRLQKGRVEMLTMHLEVQYDIMSIPKVEKKIVIETKSAKHLNTNDKTLPLILVAVSPSVMLSKSIQRSFSEHNVILIFKLHLWSYIVFCHYSEIMFFFFCQKHYIL